MSVAVFSFIGMKLKSCNFIDCNLEEADFTECNLAEANFDRAVLNRTVFFHTNLEQALSLIHI